MATIGQALTAPESGWKRYDNSHVFFYYDSAFYDYSNTSAYGGSLKVGGAGRKLRFNFIGTKLRVISYRFTDRGTNHKITIDGVEATYSERGTGVFQCLVYEVQGLVNKLHTVQIECGTDGSITFDAIDIDSDGGLIRHDYFDNLPYDEPIRKYGMAWFGFDEPLGNAIDKLGSSVVGSITGATRIDGWNGQGTSLNMSGSGQYVELNSNILNTLDKYTIRLKFKRTSSTTQQVLFRTVITTNGNGILVGFLPSTTGSYLYAYKINGSSENSSYVSDKNYMDDKWHDLIMSVDNTNKYPIKIYVDEELIAKFKGSEYNTHTTNLTMGYYSSSTQYYYNGKIDDLQIFSTTLTPSDFNQKRVAVEVSEGKVVALPSKKGRVREFPYSEELDILNQGYTWKDIDNAVDAQVIDFLQTTTEYEKVSKSKVTLTNGKMFTLPLDTNFKTIKVEGNY